MRQSIRKISRHKVYKGKTTHFKLIWHEVKRVMKIGGGNAEGADGQKLA
jgi:hypothetical protein|tara:strand:+ start:50076 stop:50222 length:147 start_codon:yes stop_codon:yes gene_type:complete